MGQMYPVENGKVTHEKSDARLMSFENGNPFFHVTKDCNGSKCNCQFLSISIQLSVDWKENIFRLGLSTKWRNPFFLLAETFFGHKAAMKLIDVCTNRRFSSLTLEKLPLTRYLNKKNKS